MRFTRKHAASTAACGLAGVRDVAPAAYRALRSRSHALDRALSRRHQRRTRARGPEDAGRSSSRTRVSPAPRASPTSAEKLSLRLLLAAECGGAGIRGRDSWPDRRAEERGTARGRRAPPATISAVPASLGAPYRAAGGCGGKAQQTGCVSSGQRPPAGAAARPPARPRSGRPAEAESPDVSAPWPNPRSDRDTRMCNVREQTTRELRHLLFILTVFLCLVTVEKKLPETS